MLHTRNKPSRNDKLKEAYRLLKQSIHLCKNDHIEQLESDVTSSICLITETIKASDMTLSSEESETLKKYLDLNREITEQIKNKRRSVKEECLKLNNRTKLSNIYGSRP